MIRSFLRRSSGGGHRIVARATVVLACLACSDAPVDQLPIPSPPGTPPPASQVTATITVDTAMRFQAMSGWEAVTQAGQEEAGFAGWQQQLLDLAANALDEDTELKDIKPWVADSGEGRWTVFESIDLDVPAPVITLALQMRFASRDEENYPARMLAALRNQFGGHAIKKAE